MTRLHVPVPLRWSDLDAYQHVNNVEMLRLLEDARITAFWTHPEAGADAWPTAVLGTGPKAPSYTIIARHEIEYLRPLGFTRTPVRVELWIGRLGGASVEVCYEVHDGDPTGRFERTGPSSGGEAYAKAATTVVVVDAATGMPRRISAAERTAWEPFVEEPLAFRRRGEVARPVAR